MARNTFAGTVAYACGMSMERMSRLMGDNVNSVFEQKTKDSIEAEFTVLARQLENIR